MTSPANRAEFLLKRRSGVGGSDAAAIIGVDPYKTALAIYESKVGESGPDIVTPAMQRGIILEPTVTELYTELTGRKVRRQAQRVHPDFPWILGNIDYQILANGDERGTGLLEVKCPGIRNFVKIQRGGLPKQWVVQGQHYLGVFGYQWMSYAVFNADLWKLLHFDIERDEAFIHGLFAAETRFWKEHVELRVPPSGLTLVPDLPGLDLPAFEGEILEREDPDWVEAASAFQQARTLRETAEAVEESTKERLKELMAARGAVEGGGLRVYWTQQAGKKTFDKKALEATRPLDRETVFMRLADMLADIGKANLPVLGQLTEMLGGCTVDFGKFDKVGKPFDVFRAFAVKPDPAQDE